MTHTRTQPRRVSDIRTYRSNVLTGLRFFYRKKALILSAFLVSIQILYPIGTIVYAASTVSNDVGSSASLDPVGNKATRLQTQGSSGVDQSSGALTYSYPLTIPEGRNGMSPKLSLSYNSQNNDSGWFGYGWTMSIPYIERTAKTGSDKMYTSSAYVSSLHGELTSINGIAYEQKVDDGSYSKYTYTGNTWQMTDRDGITYYFGNDYYSRVQSDASSTQIGRWYLREVRDKFGNGITYTYTKDQGTVYPSSISYTEHAMAHPLNLVTFTLENKNDQLVSYKYGFKTTDTKRVSAIKVSTSGKDNSYFYLGYTTGSNGARSLLQSVEEKHLSTNGDWTTLPKTTFEYDKSAPSFSGTISNSVNPYGSNSVIDTDANGILDLYAAGDGYFPVEINGDYKKDFVQAEITYGAYSSGQRINFKYNQGGTFFLRSLVEPQAPAYIRSMVAGNPIPPLRYMGENEGFWTQESVVTDVNGDGFDDVVYNDEYGSNGVGVNTTNNTFDYSTSTSLWFNITMDQLADMNGDGLQDKISKSGATTTYSIYLNNGTSYATSTYYTYNTGVNSSYDLGVRFVDINNDGLLDIVRSYSSTYSAASTGLCPGGEFTGTAPVDQSVNIALVNTGTSFTSTTSPLTGYLVNYVKCNDGSSNPYILMKGTKEHDTNGDLDVDYDGTTNNTTKQDVLKKVNGSLGSTLDVSYAWTTASTTLNPILPVPMYTVSTTTEKLSISDPSPHIVSYSFHDGQMYFDEANPRDHKFAGFGKVEVVDGARKTVTYFHQGNGDSYATGEKDDSYYNIGRAYRADTFDLSTGSSTLKSKDLSLFKTYSYASSSFTYLDSQIQSVYNSDGTYESSGSKNVYDETKRLIKTSYSYGDIEPFISFASSTISDKGSDLTVTAYEYSNSRPQRLVKQTSKDYAGQLIANTSYYYDGLPYGLVDKGVVTSALDTVYKTDGTVNSTSTTQTAYDPTGNAIQATDNLGNVTKVIYDSTYYFPVQKIDALNGTTTYSFDPYTLNLLTTKGPDGITYVKEVDGLGKVTRSYTMDTGSGMYDEIKTNYVYGGGISVYGRKMGTGGSNARSVEIYDSFGRLIQAKKETAEDVFSTQDTTYDASSNITSVSLPYTTTGYGYTTDTPTNGKTVYAYDGLGRVTNKESFGTRVTYQYGARSLTVQDDASTQHKKTYVYNAQGNISQVKEYNGGSVYTTSYAFTPTNKLSRITDANGNIRNFSYLSNGLLSYQEDPHPTTDTTYTTYSYTYDSLGNLITKTGPLGTLTYSYDVLNRPTSRILVDSTYGTSTISLIYTGCSNNYTSPCTINRGTSSTTLAYNAGGKLSSESLSIDGKTFARSYAYDTFGNPTTITYPDNGQAVYTYTLDGKHASLSYITPTGATKTIANNVSFNSMGALSSLTLGNGVQMCNTYTTASTDGVVSPKLLKSLYLFNSTGCSLSGSNQIELYKDEFTYKDNLTPSGVLSTYKDIAGTTHTKSDTFTYDNLVRLTGVSTSYNGGSAVVDTLVYDPIGNIISENDVLYRYSKDGMQNAHAATSIGGIGISYDAQGNRIQVGDSAYTWNALNQLILASSANGTESYTYDENGERIKKVVQATSVVNQKNTPATTGLAINVLSQGDLLAVVATSSTYIATSTYNTLSSLVLLDKPTLLTLVSDYYSSPFPAKFCAATSTANRQSCITGTAKQLVANNINQRSTSTVATTGLVTDVIKIATGEYLIPTSYTGIATSSIAASDPAVFSVDSGTISSYNTYIATGIIVALDEYSNLPYVSTSTYNDLTAVGLTDTTKVRAVMTLAGCDSVVSACATAKKVAFEKFYKENGYLLSDRALQEMWYVYAAKARLPGNSNELNATSTYLGSISVPVITSRTTSVATTTYYSSLYFNTEYTNQNATEPKLQYFNTIPYYITQTAFSELNTAGITQTTIENYQSQINDILGIRTASSTEYMVAVKALALHDKNVTLSWNTLKEVYLVVLGAATIPNNSTEYTQNAIYDLSSYLVINSYKTVNGQFTLQWTSACDGGYISSALYSRCVIGTSPFSLSVSTSTTVNYILSLTNSPNPTETALLMGPSTNTTMGTDSSNYGVDLPNIFISYYTQTFSTDGIRIDANVTPTIVTQQASSTSPLKIIVTNDSQWSSTPYSWGATTVTLKAYADTPRLTLASTTLVSGISSATTTSFTTGIQSTVTAYFGENHDTSFDINTGTSSPLVFISPESAVEFASTTLTDSYQLTRVFMATSTSACVTSASTTECDKQTRKTAFREIITNLSGFTPSEAATEEFWMVHKGILALPNIWFTATTTFNASSSPTFSRSNLPGTLSTTTVSFVSTTTIPGYWVTSTTTYPMPTGGSTTTSGLYTIHTFTASGSFVASSSFIGDVLIVGGGGGGGYLSGGGGGGEVKKLTSHTIATSTITVTIGAGGGNNANGGQSSFGSDVALGGGSASRGGGDNSHGATTGGSGGGGGSSSYTSGATAGSGNAHNGGSSSGPGGNYASAGGGGAGAAGSNSGGQTTGGNGGAGLSDSITGSAVYYGGGGGGSVANGSGYAVGSGGLGGGGDGSVHDIANGNYLSGGSNGTPNTGGGAGGGLSSGGPGSGTNFTGGSGIIIVRYLTSLFVATSTSYVATSTTVTPITHLDLVPPGLLSDIQFNTVYATSSFALATSTIAVSQDTYNELLRTPVRINSDVKTIFSYALPYATSTCPGEAATSSCVISAQKTKVKDTIGALSGFILSAAALEELYRVNNGEISIVPISLVNATTSSVTQTVIVPLVTAKAFKTFSTSFSSGTTTLPTTGSCSFGVNGATTSLCYINLPHIDSTLSALTFKYDVSTSSVATSTVRIHLSYINQVASTTAATSSPEFITTTSTSTLTGSKSGSATFTYTLTSLYQEFLNSSSSVFTLIPDANGTSTEVYTLSNPSLTMTRNVTAPSILYGSTTQFISFDRSTISSYATTTATTTVDLTSDPALDLSMIYSPATGSFISVAITSSTMDTTGLAAYYKLDGNANDASSFAHHGTDTSVTYSSPNGKLDQGAGFTAASDSRSSLGSITGTTVSAGSIAMWVKPSNETGSSVDRSMLGYNGWSSTSHFVFELYTRSSYGIANRPLLYVYGMSPDPAASGSYNATTDIGDGAWHQVVVTWNSTAKTVTYYVDGALDVTRTFTTLPAVNLGDVFLGSWAVGGGYRSYNNALDEAHIWTRELSLSEVSQLYNAGTGTTYPFPTSSSTQSQMYTGSVLDPVYGDLPTPSQNVLPAISYPTATSTATSTIYTLTTATTTSYTVYTPFSGYSDDSRTVTTYFTLNGKLIATYTYEKGQEASTGKVTYAITNYLGTPVLQTDVNGDIVEMDITDVFGNYVHRDQRNDNALHTKAYTGHEFDDVTGLTYAKARYLDTRAHSFLSVDPMLYKLPQSYLMDPQQMNSYAYARNNPITYTDPTGGYIESALDVGFIAYDLNSLKNNLGQGNYYDAGVDTLALAADSIGLATPFGTGFGLGVRYAGHGGDANKAFSGAKQAVNQVTENISKNNGFIQITKDKLQHVVERHAWNSPAQDASKLAKSIDPVKLINKAKDTTPTIQAKTGNLERIVTSKVNIGTDLTKQATNVYTVITRKVSDTLETLVTMFPGLPKKR